MKILVVLLMVAATTQAGYNYCKKVSTKHQLCGKQGVGEACYNTKEEKLTSKFTKDAQVAMLAKHNELRSKVALGLQANQPSAANMQEMTWDKELAAIAQALANTCIWGHDEMCKCDEGCSNGCRDVKKGRFSWVGQNLFKSWGAGSKDLSIDFEAAADKWFSENVDYPSSAVSSFSSAASTGGAVGHYTQMVWATTNKLGCGFVMWEDPAGWTYEGTLYPAYYKYTVCNYGPGGNMKGAPLYEEGSPASNCPAGTSANKDSGLCEQGP